MGQSAAQMIALYHMPGAICAQKVRVCLAEKGLAWESRNVLGQLRSPDYLRLNPGGYVPTLVHDERVLTESRIINEYLEDVFPAPALMPEDPYQRAQVSLWTKQIDDSLHLNIFTLTLAARALPHFLAMDRKALDINLPFDITKRERALDIIEKGTGSHYVGAALERFAKLVADFERPLAGSTWLVGETYSLADVDYAPYVQRLEDLGLAFLWRDKPAVQGWIQRMRARASHAEVVDRWFSSEERAATAANAQRAAEEFRALLAA